MQVMVKRPDANSLFILPSSIDEPLSRLYDCDDISADSIKEQLRGWLGELELIPNYHFIFAYGGLQNIPVLEVARSIRKFKNQYQRKNLIEEERIEQLRHELKEILEIE